ncbi:MAG TPA: hypothetical protein DCP07_00920 [Lachnospiraceae bacterium]|nr:hypothetical protein [Lachnospiraceae bacterium]
MSDNIEMIGNIKLDLTHYPGEDFYCDGAIEDEILDIVKNNDSDKYGQIIEHKKNWPILYHLSPLRGNIVEWLPISKTDKVLEIGSGCGAITGTLSAKCGQLTCVDLSKKRSLINAYRNKDRDNITIKLGNFQDVEPSLDTDYDYICLIGVFEYGKAYIDSDNPYETFLNIIKKHLAPGGRIAIAIENRMGLKYLAGCQEDHLGTYFSGIEDYPDGGVVRTFTRPGLEDIMKNCDISSYSFYYPYPDYKFMHTLFSDKRLPNIGELTTNLRNFDRDRILLFDEKNAFDSIIRDGQFPYFSNSYFVLIGDDLDINYAKYSNDRDENYAIRTDMVTKDGKPGYRKVALSEKSKAHVNKIYDDGQALIKRYEGSDLLVCPVEKEEDGIISFPYLEGDTLENKLDNCLEAGDKDKFIDYIKMFNLYLTYNKDANISDYDMVFSNILIDNNDNWKLIDYEWSENSTIPPEDIMKRALYVYRLGSEKRKNFNLDEALSSLGINNYDAEKLNQDEINFQAKVTGGRKSLSQLRDAIHYEVLPLTNAIERIKNLDIEKLVQIYPEGENGFSESTSYFLTPVKNDNNKNIIEIKLNDTKSVRVDFCNFESMLVIGDTYVNQEKYPFKKLVTNGVNLAKNTYLFPHKDPNVIFNFKKPVSGLLTIEYEISKLTETMVENFK